jgi:glycosyltransferase involved in cell wall biosynthesis
MSLPLHTWLSAAGRRLGILRPRLFTPAVQYANRLRRVAVLTPGPIPTTDIFLRPRLDGSAVPVNYIDTLGAHPASADMGEGTFVIVVRHLPWGWARRLKRERDRLAGLAYLMDDDMPRACEDPHLPLDYAVRTSWRYSRTARALESLASEVWVSTDYLGRRYPEAAARVLPPLYIPRDTPLDFDGPTYFYPGTASHRREIEWLVEVVQRVQALHPEAEFEIFGGAHVENLFRGIPRVKVFLPLRWPEFLRYTSSVTRAVGLAPCFDSPYNRARTHNKFFDITRSGAVGIYSDAEPYRRAVPPNGGIIRPNDPDAWVDAILMLFADTARRMRMYHSALRHAERQRRDDSLPPRSLGPCNVESYDIRATLGEKGDGRELVRFDLLRNLHAPK